MVVVSSITVFMSHTCVKSIQTVNIFDNTKGGTSNSNTPTWVNFYISYIIKSCLLRWNKIVDRFHKDVTIKGFGSVIWVLTKPLCLKLSMDTKDRFALQQTMAGHWVWLGSDPNNWVWVFSASKTQLSCEGTSGVRVRESSGRWATHPWIAARTFYCCSRNVCIVHRSFEIRACIVELSSKLKARRQWAVVSLIFRRWCIGGWCHKCCK